MSSPFRAPRFAWPALLASTAFAPCVAAAADAAPAPRCTVSVASDADVAAQGGFAGLAPGSTVCIAPGHYMRQFVVAGTRGTAARPVAFVVRPTGGRAVFDAGVLLRGVSFVTISGLDVHLDPITSPWAAVILDEGTNNTTVSGFTVHDSYVGIAIGSSAGGAGAGNDVAGNVVQNNWNTGIAVGDLSDGEESNLNYVQRNRVTGNGGHGIEITDADWVSIYDNVVSGNATGVGSVKQGGYSGIHLYASGASSADSPHGVRCAHDIVAFNRVDHTQERPAAIPCRDGSGSGHCTDGNGIQLDQYCSLNNIYSNISVANAGDGISLYGATRNRVFGNYVAGNNQQVGRRLFFPGPAEIAVHAINLPANSARDNVVYGNVAITTVNKVPAFYQSDNAGPNTIGPNNAWQWAPESDPGWLWGPVYLGTRWLSTAAAVDAATGTTGNVVGLPGKPK